LIETRLASFFGLFVATLIFRHACASTAMDGAIVGKLLHEPIVRLKEKAAADGAAGYVRALHELFGLDAPALEEAAS